MTLGEIIKEYRLSHAMSMDDFSKASGISKAYISLLEKNKHPKTGKPITPSITILLQSAEAMHITLDDLWLRLDPDHPITIDDPPAPTPTSIAPISDETEAELLENFRMLNVVGRRMLIDRSRELIQLGYKKGALDGLEDDAV